MATTKQMCEMDCGNLAEVDACINGVFFSLCKIDCDTLQAFLVDPTGEALPAVLVGISE